jgi:hypothetical protein
MMLALLHSTHYLGGTMKARWLTVAIILVLAVGGVVWWQSGARCRDARATAHRDLVTYNTAPNSVVKTTAGELWRTVVLQNPSCFSAQTRSQAGT